MPTWHVKIERLSGASEEGPRFVVWLFDPSGTHIKGPNGGYNNSGFLESELRHALAENYGLSGEAITSLVEIAKSDGNAPALIDGGCYATSAN